MKQVATTILAILLAGVSPAQVRSQETIPYPRADRLTTRLQANVRLRGLDTIEVSHSLYNDADSEQSAELLILLTRATFTAKVSGPWFWSTGLIQDTAAITWVSSSSDRDVPPGDSLTGLVHTDAGELSVVRYYVRGWVPPPEGNDTLPDRVQGRLPIWNDAFKGWTVAVVPLEDTRPAHMSSRFVVTIITACREDVHFITDRRICGDPRSRPRLAMQAANNANLRAACDHLRALNTEGLALPDNVITSEGRALLTTRSQQFLARHCR